VRSWRAHAGRAASLSLLVAIVLVLVGCGARTTVTADEISTGLQTSLNKISGGWSSGCVARGSKPFLCGVILRGEDGVQASGKFEVTCDTHACVYGGWMDGGRGKGAFAGSFKLHRTHT
jgi:hypothetical protein